MRIAKGAVALVALVILLMAASNLFEIVDTSHATRIQYPWGGVSWYTDTQGPKLQLLGKVTNYDRRGQIKFVAGDGDDPALEIDFNDRGTGKISGSINYEIPTDHAKLEEIYKKFPDQSNLETGLIRPAVNSAIYLTGQLMSSFESYSTRKAEMVADVEDQAQRGVYQTRVVQVEVVDEVDPTKKTTANKAEIIGDPKDQRGHARQAAGEVGRYGIRIFQFAVTKLDYDDTVNKQIQAQQAIIQRVNTSRAEALQAQQEALTAEARGRENVAKAEADQNQKNAYIVQAAKGLADKAEQDKRAADNERQATILRAQGNAEAARLAVAAGLSPAAKGDLWLESQKVWAQAFAGSTQPLVPAVVMGGSAGGNSITGAQTIMDLLATKAAKDLSLDLSLGRAPQQGSAGPGPRPTAGAPVGNARGQQARK